MFLPGITRKSLLMVFLSRSHRKNDRSGWGKRLWKVDVLSTIARILQPMGGSILLDGKRFTSNQRKRYPVDLGSCRSAIIAGGLNRL